MIHARQTDQSINPCTPSINNPTHPCTPPTNHTPLIPPQRYNRAELSALIEIHREVKRRNISIAVSNPGISSSNHATGGGGGGHHQRSLSQTGATAARAGLLSLSHPGAVEDEEGGGGEGLLRKLQGGGVSQQQQGTIAGRGAGGMVAGGNGAGDAMLSQVGLRTMRERNGGEEGVNPGMASSLMSASSFERDLMYTGRGGHRGGRAQDREQDGRRLHGACVPHPHHHHHPTTSLLCPPNPRSSISYPSPTHPTPHQPYPTPNSHQ